MKRMLIALFLVMSVFAYSQKSMPIIDIHLHGYNSIPPHLKASWAGEPAAKELSSPESADKHFQMVIQEMKKHNIKLAITSSTSLEALEKWRAEAPTLFLTGIQTDKGQPMLSPDSLRFYIENNRVHVLGELDLQYHGMAPNDPIMAPYYQIAEDYGIPVCLHTGLGPPGSPHTFTPKFRTTLGKPSLFEPVLVKHAKLKAFIAHAGYPYIEETIALMYVYPELYADLGVLAWALPKKAFYSTLRQLMDAGFGKRLMYGSDQMFWPSAISIAIETINEVPFLSDSERRDILYNNAARFLELTPEVIADHHK